MAIRAILILGAVMLGCGSIGLLLVRMTTPLLRGLGFLGVAFALGSAGAGLLLNSAWLPSLVAAVLADVFVLGAFVLLHIAVLDLVESESLLPVFGFVLLGLQVAVDLGLATVHATGCARAIVAGFLIGAQACQTIAALVPRANQRLRLPAFFVVTLLGFVALVNTARSVALSFGYFHDPTAFYIVAVGTFAIFIAIALGLGFGIFWMAATSLTAGLEQMASTDPLTRTYNRRVFLRWCEREQDRNVNTGVPFSLLMIDFDHFKAINDTYGHQTGDEVLCSAVEHMQNAIRGIDVLGRWGGEEFAALLPGATAESASLVAERLRANVARMRLPEPQGKSRGMDNAIKMTVSVGVATYMAGGDSLQQMLKRADTALYEAKALGRNRVVMGSLPLQQNWVAAPVTY